MTSRQGAARSDDSKTDQQRLKHQRLEMDGLREELDAKKCEIAALQDRYRHEYLQYRVVCQSVVGNGNRAHQYCFRSRGSGRFS